MFYVSMFNESSKNKINMKVKKPMVDIKCSQKLNK